MEQGSGAEHPIRQRIIERLRDGQVVSAREVAEAEDVTLAQAEYHLRVLEREGSAEVAETQHDDAVPHFRAA